MPEEEKIGDILTRRLREKGLLKIYRATQVVAAASKIAEGEFEPVSFRNGVLKIKACNPARAHKLKLIERSLIEAIEKEANTRINRIIFTL